MHESCATANQICCMSKEFFDAAIGTPNSDSKRKQYEDVVKNDIYVAQRTATGSNVLNSANIALGCALSYTVREHFMTYEEKRQFDALVMVVKDRISAAGNNTPIQQRIMYSLWQSMKP